MHISWDILYTRSGVMIVTIKTKLNGLMYFIRLSMWLLKNIVTYVPAKNDSQDICIPSQIYIVRSWNIKVFYLYMQSHVIKYDIHSQKGQSKYAGQSKTLCLQNDFNGINIICLMRLETSTKCGLMYLDIETKPRLYQLYNIVQWFHWEMSQLSKSNLKISSKTKI